MPFKVTALKKCLRSLIPTKRHGSVGLLGVFIISSFINILPASAGDGGAPYYLTISGAFTDAATLRMDVLRFGDNSDDNDKITDTARDYSLSDLNSYLSEQVLGDWIDSDVGDSTFEWVSSGDCQSKLRFQENRWKLIQLKINVQPHGCFDVLRSSQDPVLPFSNGIRGDATQYTETFANDHSDNVGGRIAGIFYRNIMFRRVNSNTLERVDGYGGSFVESDDGRQPGRYFSQDEQGKYVNIDSERPSASTYWGAKGRDFIGGDYYDNGVRRIIIRSPAATESAPPTEGSTGGGTDDEEPTCESKGGPFGWILCQVFNGVTSALDTFAGFVQDRLDVEIQDEASVRGAWNNIRTIANVVFVMAFLFIIISQTLVGRF